MASRESVIIGVTLKHLVAALPRARFGLASRPRRRAAWARALRLAFEELGPAFIKLGQLISVRPDEFSEELVTQMRAMQDAVPALPARAIRDVIITEFGVPPEQLWATFDNEPLASASIAQVHRATLADPYRPVWGETLPAGARRGRQGRAARCRRVDPHGHRRCAQAARPASAGPPSADESTRWRCSTSSR